MGSSKEHVAICRLLRDRGADGIVPDMDNNRAFDTTVRTNNFQSRRVIAPSCVDVDLALAKSAISAQGSLLHAIYENDVKQVKQLLEVTREQQLVEVTRGPNRVKQELQRLEATPAHDDQQQQPAHSDTQRKVDPSPRISRFSRKSTVQPVAQPQVHPALEPTGAGRVQPLMIAAYRGSKQMVDLLLREGGKDSINSKSNSGSTALMWAVIEDHAEIAKTLIDAGADVSITDHEMFTPLMLAAIYDCAHVLRTLLDSGAKVEAVQFTGDEKAKGTAKCGRTALHWSAAMGVLSTTSELIKSKAGLEDREYKNGATPLALACAQGHVKTAECLIESKAVVDALRNAKGLQQTPLMLACEAGHESVARLLVKSGARIYKSDDKGSTALMLAAAGGFVGTVRALLQFRAEIDHQTPQGFTALMRASEHGHAEAASVLIEAKAEVDKETRDGKTALMLAVVKQQPCTVRLLLLLGADPWAHCSAGRNTLHVACELRNLELVKLLLMAVHPKKQKDMECINKVSKSGDAPLGLAIKGDAAFSLIEMLLRKRAHLDVKDGNNLDILELAGQKGLPDTYIQDMKRIAKEAAKNVAADVAQDKALSARHETPSSCPSSSSQASARQGGTSLLRMPDWTMRAKLTRGRFRWSSAPDALSSPRGGVTETVSSTA